MRISYGSSDVCSSDFLRTEQRWPVVEGLAGQPGEQTVATQGAGIGRVTHQSTRGRGPHLTRRADQHAARGNRREAAVLIDAKTASKLRAIPVVAFQRAQQRQPDRAIAGDGETVNPLVDGTDAREIGRASWRERVCQYV